MSEKVLLPRVDSDAEQLFDPYLLSMVELERIARALDLEDSVLEPMRHPELELTIHLPAARADGATANLCALQCLYSHNSGCIAELMIGPEVYLNQVRASAFANDLCCALLGVSLRGAAAGFLCDLAHYSEGEMRRLVREYCQRIKTTTPNFFGLSRVYGGNRAIYGWLGHDLESAGGGAAAVRLAESQWTLLARWIAELVVAAQPQASYTYAIQGPTVLGLAIAQAVTGRWNTRVVMMSDAGGAVVNEAGLDLEQLEKHLQNEQVLFGCPGAEQAYGADLPLCACDVLVLQAPMQITAANAGQVRARLIVECTPDAVSHEGKTALAAAGVEVIPEIVVRSGLVLLSSVDSAALPLDGARARALLRRSAAKLMSDIRGAAATWKIELSRAALSLAIERRADQIRRAGM